jgi:hypothetical protein
MLYSLRGINMTSRDIYWFRARNMRTYTQRHEHSGVPGCVLRKANSFAMDLPDLTTGGSGYSSKVLAYRISASFIISRYHRSFLN